MPTDEISSGANRDHIANSRTASSLLLIGVLLGLVLTAVGLLSAGATGRRGLPADAVALVNGQPIRRVEYERVLNGLAQDSREPPGAIQQRHVLDRLIDEELLIERGLELNVARDDSRVRKDLTAAVIDSVITDTADAAPADSELRKFYDEQRAFFVGPGRLRVRQIFCRVVDGSDTPAAVERAWQAAARLRAHEDFGRVQAALGDAELAPLPESPLPVAKLVDYLGPTAARTAAALGVGEISDPVRSNNGLHVLQVLDRQADTAPPFEQIKPQVLAEFRRRASEQALRTYLDDLRAHATVVVAPQLP